jgi:NDP-sugar pyrophosphorylase family protein
MTDGGPLPPVALLAGGLATRLRPLTEKFPKSMIEVAGEPFVAHQLRLCRRKGIDRIVICAGYLSEQIEAYVGNGSRFGLDVRYSVDWPQLLGTGGAIKKAIPLLGETFFILYGDAYLDISYRAVFDTFTGGGLAGLMTVFHNRDRWDKSNVEFAGGVIRRYDKVQRTPAMEYIDYGLGLLKAHVFADWPEGSPFDLAEVYRVLVANQQLAGYEVKHRFYEIGSHGGLKELRLMLRRSENA